MRELKKLGIEALEFSGEKEVLNTRVLGKGYVGIVTVAYREGERVALKMRRMDADRSGMQREAEMLRRANSVHVGPRFLDADRNFLLMQLIDGDLLPEWLEKHRGNARVRKVLREILEQCWLLDRIGLDHGELSNAPKHIIINEECKPFIVDFETASLDRKPSNVTSACQFLFISGLAAKRSAGKLGVKDRAPIIEALRRYKINRTRENFEKILDTCSL